MARSTLRRRGIIAVVAVALIAANLAIAYLVANIGDRPTTLFLMTAAAIVIAVVGVAATERDRFSPLVLSGFFYLMAFVVGALFFWFNPDWGQAKTARPYDHDALLLATLLGLVAWLCFAAGYKLKPFRFLRVPAISHRDISDRALLGLYSLGWLPRLANIASGRYLHNSDDANVASSGGTSAGISLAFSTLPAVAVAYLGLTGRMRLFWVGVAAEVAFALPSAARGRVVGVGVLVLVVLYYRRGRFPVRPALLTLVACVFFVFPVVVTYRNPSFEFDKSTATQSLKAALVDYSHQSPSKGLQAGLGATAARFSDVTTPAAVFYSGRGTYPLSGESFVWTATNLVPKAIWPDKPSGGAFGLTFARAYGIAGAGNFTTGVALPQSAESYANFGWVGVIICMFLIGGLYQIVATLVASRRNSPMVGAIYGVLSYQIAISHETILSHSYTGLLKATFVVWAAIFAATYLFPATATKRASVMDQLSARRRVRASRQASPVA